MSEPLRSEDGYRPARPALVECIPNVSEGRRRETIEEIAEAIRSVPGVGLLDIHSDGDHHRSVFTFAGERTAVAEAAFRLAEVAIRRIDLRQHRGTHPRIGALDVLPFVPLAGTDMGDCVALAREVGERIASSLGIPIFFYGEAALRAERRLLVNVRRGEYEELLNHIGELAFAPDMGPAVLGPAGATAIGARGPLIAFNIHLRTGDLAVARSIARAVRESSGGLAGVQALGFSTARPEIVQVSMNITRPDVTPLHAVVAFVRNQARDRGVEVAESELVGLIPASVALAASGAALGLPRLDRAQVIELALADALAAGG